MVEDDGAPHTINLCKYLHQWKAPVTEKSSRGKLSAGVGMRGFEHKMWECYAAKKMVATSQLEDVETAIRLGKCWIEETSYKEELSLLRESGSLHLPDIMARRAIRAGRADDWSELRKTDEVNPWTWSKLQEFYHEVKQVDDQRKSVVQIMQRSTDFLRRIIVPVEGQGRVPLSWVCPHCHRYPLED